MTYEEFGSHLQGPITESTDLVPRNHAQNPKIQVIREGSDDGSLACRATKLDLTGPQAFVFADMAKIPVTDNKAVRLAFELFEIYKSVILPEACLRIS